MQIFLNCDNRAYQIRETFDFQWNDSIVSGHNGLSHSPRQGWCYKRYHHHANSCLSRPHSTVIISTLSDSLTWYLIFTTRGHTKIWNHAEIASAYIDISLCVLFTGTPSPLKPAFFLGLTTGASTHLTVTLLSFCHTRTWGREKL